MPTKIPWTDESWNPVIGCSKVSEGCLNCYAEKMAARLASMGIKKYEQVIKYRSKCSGLHYDNRKAAGSYTAEWNGNIVCDESALDKPLHWKKPRRIFVCSMSDLFHEKVPFEFIIRVFDVIRRCQQHTFQVLTKRPERLLQIYKDNLKKDWPISPNLWFGVSVENEKNLHRLNDLIQIPAAVRFVSVEPMLGPIDIALYLSACREDDNDLEEYGQLIDWVIIGAESIGGHAGRECKLAWVRDLVLQCKAAGVPVFVKQLHIKIHHPWEKPKLSKDMSEWPEDLRLKEWPVCEKKE